MPHFMIVLILYVNLLNLSWIKECLCLRNMEHLPQLPSARQKSETVPRKIHAFAKMRLVSDCNTAVLYQAIYRPLTQ